MSEPTNMSEHTECESFIVTDQEAGERLDKVLAKYFEERQSRTYFQYLIDQNLVLVNGHSIKKRTKLKIGDEINVQFVLTPEVNLKPENIPLDVLYEDAHILVVNKPAGLVVHPAPGHWSGTFVNALLFHCRLGEGINDALRPGIVHRLDKDTSGVLVAAKTVQALQRLIEQFSGRQVYKEYLAICIGNPGKIDIEAPIGRHPVHRKQMAVIEDGKKALSRCQTLAYNDKLSVVKIELVTGRTHQIRVHMKHHGTPVLGDETYGSLQINKRHGIMNQMLHAALLSFKHPITEEQLEFRAPIPQAMGTLIQKITGKPCELLFSGS